MGSGDLNEEGELIQRCERFDKIKEKLALEWMYNHLRGKKLENKTDEVKMKLQHLKRDVVMQVDSPGAASSFSAGVHQSPQTSDLQHFPVFN